MKCTSQLKATLWKRFGALEHPAEWDGRIYGGGKLSQRYWEYFKTLELLDLSPNSVVVDIGGGSPVTGVGFFASLIATAVRKVFVFDSNISPEAVAPDGVEFVREKASFESMSGFLKTHPEVTHVASVSVFEHIPALEREGIVRAINENFKGESFVASLEYHAKSVYFEYQLTAGTISTLFEPMTRYYLDKFESSPVWCENAYPMDVPLWYPIAVRFLPVGS
jgi:hypothetical protein